VILADMLFCGGPALPYNGQSADLMIDGGWS
jgi:hypothetical protein